MLDTFGLQQLSLSMAFGASIALFFAAVYYMLLFAMSVRLFRGAVSPHTRQHIIKIFILAGIAYTFFGVFNIYVLQLHFPEIKQIIPNAFFEWGKFAAPISLLAFTIMFTQSVPVKSLDAFVFWQDQEKYYNMLYLLDVIFIMALFMMDNPSTIVGLSLLLFVPHCLAGVVFSFKGLSSIELSKFYGLLFLAIALVMGALGVLELQLGFSYLPSWLLVTVHIVLGIAVLMLSFVVARFNQQEAKRTGDTTHVKMKDFFANIYAALESDEFYLVYQPKLDAQTDTPCGMEALIRWQHPKKGNIPPCDFIPAAEETEIIDNICQWTIAQAVKDAVTFLENGITQPISINFSVKNLQPEMVDRLYSLMKENGLPNDSVVVEITESMFFHKSDKQTQALDMLAEYGIPLSLDDYGAGFSSLSHLDQIGIDEIKIDKSFIINMDKSEKNMVIVNSTIQMGHALGIAVVAEGVENDAMKSKLTELNCDRLQGYGIAKPMKANDVIQWFKSES